MTLTIFLTIVALHLTAAATPGPSFVVIARTTVTQSRAAAITMAVGLGCGALFWATAALFGLTLLFQVLPWTFAILKIAGGAFLIWIAYNLIRHAKSPLGIAADTTPAPGALQNFRRGLLVQIANPKVSIFFGSIFVTLMPADAGWAATTAMLATIFAVETAWYTCVATIFAVPQVRHRYITFKTAIDRTCGGILGLLGLKLATG